MVAQYTRRFYNPAAARWQHLTAEACARARAFARWKVDMEKAWPELAIKDVIIEVRNGDDYIRLNPKRPQLKVGSQLCVRALVELGKVNPADISVELYHGPMDGSGNIKEGSAVKMEYSQASEQDGKHWFTGSMPCRRTGQHGLDVRVLPRHPDMINPFELRLILWGAKAAKKKA